MHTDSNKSVPAIEGRMSEVLRVLSEGDPEILRMLTYVDAQMTRNEERAEMRDEGRE